MPNPEAEQIRDALADLRDPVLDIAYRDLDVIRYETEEGQLRLSLELGYPLEGIRASLEQTLRERLEPLDGVDQLELELTRSIPRHSQAQDDALKGVANVIAVASGKGGVGKSTTAVNLALALAHEGARVGILDADIHGPSQPRMLDTVDARPEVVENRYMYPVAAHGLKSMSMGYLVTEKTPTVWRGPMASGAFQQLSKQTQWGELDYLIVDMPPGTGDIQLSLSQQLPVAGGVIVTTPQDLALQDARKGIEMFRKVRIPVLGIVENMATHVCSHCGHEEHIFGSGGGERIAEQYDTTVLGSLPLDPGIREQADSGRPSVLTDPESAASRTYRDIARRTAARLWLRSLEARGGAPEIEISED